MTLSLLRRRYGSVCGHGERPRLRADNARLRERSGVTPDVATRGAKGTVVAMRRRYGDVGSWLMVAALVIALVALLAGPPGHGAAFDLVFGLCFVMAIGRWHLLVHRVHPQSRMT